MTADPKRQLLRHLLATIAFRGSVAIAQAPNDFASFRISPDIRTPGEIVAHIGDLIEGSHYLMKGEMVYLSSQPGNWKDDVERMFSAIQQFDSFLSTDFDLAQPVEKLVQGPIGDALTHIGQIVMLRRAAGSPVTAESYYSAEIIPGKFTFPFIE